jgi:Yip1 domain
MNCPACNHSLAEGARFCAACGAKVNVTNAAPDATAPAATAAPAAAAAGGAAAAGAAAWDDVKRQFPGLVERARNILLTPGAEWQVIAAESTSTAKLYTGYVMPLGAIAPVASLIGMSLVGISVPFMGTIRTPIVSSLMYAIVTFVLTLVGVFVLGLIINALAPTFAGEKHQTRALQVAAYAQTPVWLAGICYLVPMLSMLVLIAALYALYLLYLGLPILMKAPKEKAAGYTAVVVLCAIVLGIVAGAVGGAMTGAGGYSMMGMHGSAIERRAASEKAGAAAAGALVGGLFGQDESGKAAIGAAVSKMADLGRQMEQQAAQTKRQAAPAGGSATDASPASPDLATAAGALGALGSALSGGKTVEPVDFRILKRMLPDVLNELQRTNASGERNEMMGIQVSTAEADYQDGASGRVHVKISDLGTLTSLSAMAAALEPRVDKETDTGYEKTTQSGGRQIHESYDRGSQRGEFKVLLDGRFEVTVSGTGVKMETIKSALATLDLSGLEAMKMQGVKQQ